MQAVDGLHSRKLAYRDIKPDNVIIVGDSPATRQLFLIDLETLFHLDGAPIWEVAGTNHFLKREQFPLTATWLKEADFFAVGAMFAITVMQISA